MDLNYLYKRHQIALFMALNAANSEARLVHRELADAYASRIAIWKNGLSTVAPA